MNIYTKFTFCYMLLITYLSHMPQSSTLDYVPEYNNMDLVLHFVEYTILGFFLFKSLSTDDFFNINSIYGSIIIGILFGILDELHQNFVPGRQMSLIDALSDSLGVLFGVYISLRFFSD